MCYTGADADFGNEGGIPMSPGENNKMIINIVNGPYTQSVIPLR